MSSADKTHTNVFKKNGLMKFQAQSSEMKRTSEDERVIVVFLFNKDWCSCFLRLNFSNNAQAQNLFFLVSMSCGENLMFLFLMREN